MVTRGEKSRTMLLFLSFCHANFTTPVTTLGAVRVFLAATVAWSLEMSAKRGASAVASHIPRPVFTLSVASKRVYGTQVDGTTLQRNCPDTVCGEETQFLPHRGCVNWWWGKGILSCAL